MMIPLLLLALTATVVAAVAGLGFLLRLLPRPVTKAGSRPVSPRRGPSPVGLVLPPGEEGHLAAALAFQEAADRYVAMCERRVAEARYWRAAVPGDLTQREVRT
jgi:hypothetical protein